MTREEAIEYLDNYRKMYAELAPERFLEALDVMLNEPSLPSNIDDAAQKIEDYYDVGEEHGYLCCHRGDIKDAFKAGAEWMAKQGETIFDTIDVDGGERWLSENLLQGDYDCGEEVIVQVRKK